jgi:hypothetical protein
MESRPNLYVDRLAEQVPCEDAVNDALPLERAVTNGRRSLTASAARKTMSPGGRQPITEVTIRSAPRPRANRRLRISNRRKEQDQTTTRLRICRARVDKLAT